MAFLRTLWITAEEEGPRAAEPNRPAARFRASTAARRANSVRRSSADRRSLRRARHRKPKAPRADHACAAAFDSNWSVGTLAHSLRFRASIYGTADPNREANHYSRGPGC